MFPSKKLSSISTVLDIIVLSLGLFALILRIIYNNHTWNNIVFRENRQTDGYIILYILFILCMIISGFFYLFFRKKDNGTKERLVTQILFWLSNCATLAIIILFACDFTNIVRDFKDLRLDNQLKSIDVTKFHEAVDSVISRTNNTILYGESAPNEYMLSAARKGYAPAQNYIGVYFHEQAKKINDNHYGYNSYAIRRWNATSCEFCQEELNRATYWWLKAALQNYGHAQENLGRLKMESLLTNQSYAFGDARYWLTEATKNDVISAYYYLGLLLRKHTITEAAKYWQLGAEKGDENCMRMLENPDFIDIETSTYISETNEPQI